MLFDRYYYDVIADPVAAVFGCPNGCCALSPHHPASDLQLLLSVGPEVARTRKQELTVGEITQLIWPTAIWFDARP